MNQTVKKISVAVAVIVALLVVIVLVFRAGSGSALKRYKAELRAKGEKLTFQELLIAPSTNAEEVAALNVLAGYSGSYTSPLASSVYPLTMDYVAPGKARVGWQAELRSANASNWVTVDWQTLEKDNLRAAPDLAKIRPALLVSPPDSGWIYYAFYTNAMNGPATNYVRDRVIAQALVRDVMGELHKGNLDAALADLHALVGQVSMNRNELTVVSQMIRVAIAGLALDATWEALQAPGWDEVRLAGLQHGWEQAEFLTGLARSFEGVRAEGELAMTRIRNGSIADAKSMFNLANANPPASPPVAFTSRLRRFWNEDAPWVFYRLTGGANRDELTQLQFSTRVVEWARALKSGRPWPEVDAGLLNVFSELDRKFSADRFHRLKVSALTLPNFSRAFRVAIYAETQRRLTITAIAIKRFQIKHDAPPPDLAALTPELLCAVPIDPMSGRPLRYRLNADGAFVLYSVGEDGVDDGGDSTPRETGGKPGLWEGRDAVWPTAATPEEEAAAAELKLQIK